MKISQQIEIAATPERAWEVVSDPYAVVECVPGATIDRRNDDGSYDITVIVTFGPIRLPFRGRLALELEPEAHRGRLTGDGQDSPGGTRIAAKATFVVAPAAAGASVAMNGDVDISGRFASFVSGSAGTMVDRMAADFGRRLAARCARES